MPATHTPSIQPTTDTTDRHPSERSGTTTENVREAASTASSPPAGATEGPFSARFPSWPYRGDIPAVLRQPGGWR